MSIETTKQAEELIEGWMKNGDFFDPKTSPTPIPDGFHFILGGKTANTIPFSILQPKELKKTVVVLANVELIKEHFETFRDMKSEDRNRILWNLQRDLIFAPPTYSFNPEYHTDGTFKGVQFTKEISYDELTEGRLGNAVTDVTKCVLWVIWTFMRLFAPSEE